MSPTTFVPGPLRGQITVPGDKSISHRALILLAAGREPVVIRNLNPGRDVRATAQALESLGASVARDPDDPNAVLVTGAQLRDATSIDCMNSGSTARMLLGVCAGADIQARFDGDASLRKRPMEPVSAQLRAFGARIETTEGTLPATIVGSKSPQTRTFILISPSAQIKSALLFAGVFGNTSISILGDKGSRDHTERLLRYFGADIAYDRANVDLRSGPSTLRPVDVAGDFSSAAFFIVAATVAPGSRLVITNVGVNPSRTGLLDALWQMGANIRLENECERSGEPVADIVVEHAVLHGTQIGSDLALRAIDELPVLSTAAAFARGETRITGVRELRAKESDRVAAIERMLHAVGIGVEALPNGISITGGNPRGLPGASVRTDDDHRTAMSVAALAAGAGPLQIDSESSIDVSFPNFIPTLQTAQA